MFNHELTQFAEKMHRLGQDGEEDIADILAGAALDGDGTLARQIYRLLRTLIVEMRLLPNRFLPEKDVSGHLNLSKTPVREALIRLADDGMVRIFPKSGTFVAPIDIDRVYEGYFVRSSLEASCAARLAGMRTDADIARLRTELARQRDALAREEHRAFYKLDNQFHDTLFAAAGIPHSRSLIAAATFDMERIRSFRLLYRILHVNEVMAEHTAVVDAVEKRDPTLARDAMLGHFGRMNDSIETLRKDQMFWNMFHNLNRGGRPRRRTSPVVKNP